MGKQTKITPEAQDPLRPEFRGLSSDLASYAGDVLKRGTTPRVSGLSGAESSIIDRVGTMTAGPTMFDQAQPLISDILGGSRLLPSSNPFLQSTIDALGQNYDKRLGSSMNLLDAAFNRSGMVNSSGRSAEGVKLAQDSMGDFNNTVASILSDNYNRGTAEQMSMLGMVPSFASGNLNFLQDALSTLSMPRTVETAQASDAFSGPLELMQSIASILGGVPGLQYTQPSYAPSTLDQIVEALSGLGQAGMGYASMAKMI